MKTAVIYARYSSDNQTEQSIEGQLRVCNEFAKSKNIVILDTYIDRAMTGTNDNRPDFQRMLKDSAKKQWDYVIVYKLDRFSRNKYEMTIHKHTLKENGAKLLSAMENIPDSPEGVILESLLEGMNQYYSAELSQKVKRGMKETRLKGNFTGGNLLYGYKVIDHKVQIVEDQAEVVRYIYRQYNKGVYVKDICKELKEKGIDNKGKPFTPHYIYKMLSNFKYSGIYIHDNIEYTNIYPQIIDIDTFKGVREIIEKNKYGSRSNDVIYLLRQKLVCGYCGKPISAESGTTRHGQVKKYYKCLGRKHNNGCKKENVRKEDLERYVIDNITDHLSKSNNMNYLVNSLYEIQIANNGENKVIAQLIKQKRQTENSINNIMSAIENGGTAATVMKRLRELEELLTNTEKQLAVEKTKQSVILTKAEIKDYYIQALRLEPLMLINYLVKQITVFDDKIIIEYNTPKTISPDESQGFLLYDKIIPLHTKYNAKAKTININLIIKI